MGIPGFRVTDASMESDDRMRESVWGGGREIIMFITSRLSKHKMVLILCMLIAGLPQRIRAGRNGNGSKREKTY